MVAEVKAADVVRYAEISYRQLDHWCRQGYLKPLGHHGANPGSGRDREFSRDEANKAKMMQCLISLGFEVHLAEKVATFAVLGEYNLYVGHGVTLKIEPHDHKESR